MNMKSTVLFVLSLSIVLFSLTSRAYSNAATVEKTEVDLFDETRNRPHKLTIWYPSSTSKSCLDSQICLSKNANLNHAVLLSHGAMGSVREMNWLAYGMASQGIVVVGINHYEESWVYGKDSVDYSAVLRLWQRPLDISFVLDTLQKQQTRAKKGKPKTVFNADIDWNNTTVIGHSSGGATALFLAGAQYNGEQALSYCKSEQGKKDRSCAYLKHLPKSDNASKAEPQFNLKALEGSYLDKRVKRIITLDPAIGHAMDKSSLAKLSIPVMIIGSVDNDFLPFESHAKAYADAIAQAKLIALNKGEGHFIYLDECEHDHKAMGVSLCKDRKGVDRKAVHNSLFSPLFNFIYSS